MKNKYLLQLFISVLAFGILACSDDIQEITLNVGENEIFFDSSDAQNKEVTIETNSSSITIDIQEDGRKWCSARRYDNIIYISVTKNTIVGDNRKTSITITAREGETRTILVTQAASDKYISSFIIPADINNLKADINGVINNKEKNNYNFNISLDRQCEKSYSTVRNPRQTIYRGNRTDKWCYT